jgi:hypothetical protein
MNLKLKAVYFAATSDRRWGKGVTLARAKMNAFQKERSIS